MDVKDKLDQLQDSIDEIASVQVEQKYILIEHQRRSAANEARLDVMESIRDEFHQHISQLRGAITAFKWIGSILTISVVLTQLITYIRSF